MARQKATEKPSRESFTLNMDNERDRAIKLFLSTQNNKAEFIKNVLYKYISKNDTNIDAKIDTTIEDSTKNYINNSTNIDTTIKSGVKNNANNSTKNDVNINCDVKNGIKNSTNNYIIDIDETAEEVVQHNESSSENEDAFENAFKGLGL